MSEDKLGDELQAVLDAHGIIGPARTVVGEREVIAVEIQLACALDGVLMVEVARDNATPPVIVYKCPKCNQGVVVPLIFPRIEFRPKPVIQTANFVNPNRGPQGRRH